MQTTSLARGTCEVKVVDDIGYSDLSEICETENPNLLITMLRAIGHHNNTY